MEDIKWAQNFLANGETVFAIECKTKLTSVGNRRTSYRFFALNHEGRGDVITKMDLIEVTHVVARVCLLQRQSKHPHAISMNPEGISFCQRKLTDTLWPNTTTPIKIKVM